MYKIIGADGKEYGPVSLEQLQQWLDEGRINQATRVLPDGSADWKTLAEIPELATILPPPAAPPSGLADLSRTSALQMVRGPAIFILVLAILNILTSGLGVVWSAYQDQIQEQLLGLSKESEQVSELQRKLAEYFSLPANVLGGVLAVVCLVGSLRMMKLESYPWAMATAIIMLIPCGNCCCFLNIGAGIWALVVLSKPEIKAAFQ